MTLGRRVLAALTTALHTAVPVVFEALTVELQAAGTGAVAMLWESVIWTLLGLAVIGQSDGQWDFACLYIALCLVLYFFDDFQGFLSLFHRRFVHFSAKKTLVGLLL